MEGDRAGAAPRRRATMSDVASHAGVSLKSVSRVVNGESHVSAALAERVWRAVEALDYRPDSYARRLARDAGSRLVGYVQVDAANPFFSSVHRGLEDVVRQRGLTIISGSTDAEPERETQLLSSLVEWRVEGLVIAAAEGADATLRAEVDRGTAVVCVDRVLDDLACDTVVGDNRSSAAAAVNHLLAQGHERVAFLGGDLRIWTARERLAGYREALDGRGLEPAADHVVVGLGGPGPAEQATRALLGGSSPPTALFAAQDRICAGAVRALHELGVADEVALFGFDDLPFADLLRPSISAVAQQPYEMGRRAAELLLSRLEERSAAPPVFDVVPALLHHRASGEIRPA